MTKMRVFNPFPMVIALGILGLGAAAVLQSLQRTAPPTLDQNGCLWDYDTLRFEAKGMPSTIEAITGRFDRYPALYYQMRLKRVTAELALDPSRLDLYDDAGVACDRLGRHDEAIEWMARKRARLDANPDTEHEYRYLANLGTFHAHRWLGTGGVRSDLSDLEAARDLIARAIELNSDAHFGRERYQLLAIEWLIALPNEVENEIGLPWAPNLFDADSSVEGLTINGWAHNRLAENRYEDAVEGLTGLMTLGAAWESVDVLYALELALADRGDTSVAYLADLRLEELRRSKSKWSVHPDFDARHGEAMSPDAFLPDAHAAKVRSYFKESRQEADGWFETRNEYLMARLQSGLHPDTHAAFWDDWAEGTRAPAMPGSSLSHAVWLKVWFLAVVAGLFFLVSGLVLLGRRSVRAARGLKVAKVPS